MTAWGHPLVLWLWLVAGGLSVWAEPSSPDAGESDSSIAETLVVPLGDGLAEPVPLRPLVGLDVFDASGCLLSLDRRPTLAATPRCVLLPVGPDGCAVPQWLVRWEVRDLPPRSRWDDAVAGERVTIEAFVESVGETIRATRDLLRRVNEGARTSCSTDCSDPGVLGVPAAVDRLVDERARAFWRVALPNHCPIAPGEVFEGVGL
ncbi:MAG: hypothetical protein D6685_16020 [Bacteroidetes bacterium]|nr:MAG: hypothetical protein D6685_16020 [Bacteroidota bacterium]